MFAIKLRQIFRRTPLNTSTTGFTVKQHRNMAANTLAGWLVGDQSLRILQTFLMFPTFSTILKWLLYQSLPGYDKERL